MGTQLNDIYNNLKDIRTYLIKIGPDRRKGDILLKKLEEAKIAIAPLDKLIEDITVQIDNSEIREDDVTIIKDIQIKIKNLYAEILAFKKTENRERTGLAMAQFDLKIAVSLLPVMNGSEDRTKQLIDAIELYDSMLLNDSKQLLINFILKTRLTTNAKLRLKSTYTTVQALLTDIRKHLLTQKSDVALQSKLNSMRQGDKTIEQFGKELEELFVDLTISQAQNNDNAYEILRPINEKNAIKRFSDGLRNQKLSTIISSRNYSYLKDAIRAALDEEIAHTNNTHVMAMAKHHKTQYNTNRQYNNNTHRQYNNYRQSSNQPNPRNNTNTFSNNHFNRYNRTNFNNNYRHNNYSNNSYHGNNNNFRGKNRNSRINFMTENRQHSGETVTQEDATVMANEKPIQFFRDN